MQIECRSGRLGFGLAVLAGLLSACGGGGGGNAGAGQGQLVKLLTTTIPNATSGAHFHTQIEAQFVHEPGVFQITSGDLPPGVKLDKNTGILDGYPRQTGTFHLEIAARDGVDLSLPPGRDANFAEDRRIYDFVVALGPPNILPQTPTLAVYRKNYFYQIDVAGGIQPYSFVKVGGALPSGLTVNAFGGIGTFPTSYGASPYEFQVRVTDANGQQDTETLSLNLILLPLTILTSSIPEAAVGFAYDRTIQLASTGGGNPIVWSQVAPVPGEVLLSSIGMEISADGHLRNAIGFTGPTTVGTFQFTLQVTDEPLQVATRQFTLVVNPGPVLTSITPNRASAPGPYVVSGLNIQPGAQIIFKPGPTQTIATTTFVDSTTMTFNGPAPKPSDGSGAVPVMLKNPDGGSYTKPNGFIFPAATIGFATKGFISSALSSTGLDAAEVTGDGRADVIHCGASGLTPYSGASTSTNAGLILMKSAGGTPLAFASTTLDAGNFYDCKFVDVNLDGKLDIVALGQTQIKTWINNPLGTFNPGPTTTLASGMVYPSVLAMGRLNSDLIPDVAVGFPHNPSYGMANYNGRVDLMMGTGTGLFVLQDQAVSSMPWQYGVIGMACIDTDGDGRDEVAAGVGMGNFTSSPPLNYAPTTAVGSFGTWLTRGAAVAPPYYGSTTSVAVGDFQGSGQLQAITTHSSTYSAPARIFSLYAGTALTSQTTITPPSTVMKCVSPLDADFDGKMDFAVSTVASNLLVYKGGTLAQVMTIDTSVGSPATGSPRTGRVCSADLDGDGRPDLLATTSYWQVEEMAANYGSPYALLATGNGGTMGVVYYLNTSN